MGSLLYRIGIAFALPMIVLIASVIALVQIPSHQASVHEFIQYGPYLLLATGMLLSLRFKRSGVFFVLVSELIGLISYQTILQNGQTSLDVVMIYAALGLFLPLNTLVFSLLKERGTFNLHGSLRFAFILLEFSAVLWGLFNRQVDVMKLLTRPLIPAQYLPPLTLPQSVLALQGLCLIIFLLRCHFKASPLLSGYLGALLTNCIGLFDISADYAFPLFISASSLILILSVLQESYNMAYRDELTGIPSRRALNNHLARLGRRYVIAMLDVDHFKSFNTKYGHDVGDQVLQLVASRVSAVTGGGYAYRYGGEEFTVIFPRKSKAEATQHLEMVRQTIEQYEFVIRGGDRPKEAPKGIRKFLSRRKAKNKSVSVTISIGVAERTDEYRTPEEVIKAADQALYRAKDNGRNQVSE